MGNPETHATLGTIHRTKTNKTKTTTQKSKKMSNTDPIKIPELNPFVRTFNKLTVQNFNFVEVFCKLQTMYVLVVSCDGSFCRMTKLFYILLVRENNSSEFFQFS
jgi:hypothetical protein